MQRAVLSGVLALALIAESETAHADLDARAILGLKGPSASVSSPPLIPSALTMPGSDRVSLLIELPPGVDPRTVGLLPAAPGFAGLSANGAELARLASAHPDWQISWSPPRRPLLDRAASWARAPHLTSPTARKGRGVIVGIVDTGIDTGHPDLRDAADKTRVRWLIDFSRSPAGRYPDFETAYGCGDAANPCAILGNAEIDELIENNVRGDEPRDEFGHGTHVASLAAGDGTSNPNPNFIGIAPEATLIGARVTRTSEGAIFDMDILRAVSFIFDRANELGMPAVVNLSLGSEFGGHDGSAALERGLSAFVGPDKPGRSIVVAAGNSAGLYVLKTAYPDPLGSHTELHLPPESDVRVPLLTPPVEQAKSNGTIFVWISMRPGDEIDVGFEGASGDVVGPLEPGDAGTFHLDDLEVTIFNGPGGKSPVVKGSAGAVVTLKGSWKSGAVFAIHLQGRGTASLWVQSEGDVGPGAGSSGALFPRATKESTVNIPATHPLLIAAGATLNRVEWPIHTGEKPMQIHEHGSLVDPISDSIAYFSSAGPSATGLMKPDIVAPGAYVAGAMSRLADPRKAENAGHGIFGATERCVEEYGIVSEGTAPALVQCFVVDAWHAITSGTSMSAPIVSGAVALLLEGDPTLTQPEIIALLQAGARRPAGSVLFEPQMGPGALDVAGAIAAQDAQSTPVSREPAADRSWLALAASYAHPDPKWPLRGVLELRDANGSLADGFDRSRLRLDAWPAVSVELERAAPGMFRFAVAAPPDAGGLRMHLLASYDGKVLAERQVPISVDAWVASEGVDARGGCALSRTGSSGESWASLAALALLLLRQNRLRASPKRQCSDSVRTVQCPGRTDTTRQHLRD